MTERAPNYDATPAREAPRVQLAPCPVCEGSGQVEGVRAEWIRVGEEMRLDREARGLSLAEEAKAREMPQVILRDMERGLVRPVPREGLAL